MPLRAASIAAAVGLLALVVVVAIAGAHKELRPLGTNGVRPLSFIGDVPPNGKLCQQDETIPKGTAALWMRIGTYGAPGPKLTVTLDGRATTYPAGWSQGDKIIPIARVDEERTGVELCVVNSGPAKMAIAGENVKDRNAKLGATELPGRVRVQFEPAAPRSGWSNLGAITERISIVRAALPGVAAFPLYVLLALLVVGGAVALVLREART